MYLLHATTVGIYTIVVDAGGQVTECKGILVVDTGTTTEDLGIITKDVDILTRVLAAEVRLPVTISGVDNLNTEHHLVFFIFIENTG